MLKIFLTNAYSSDGDMYDRLIIYREEFRGNKTYFADKIIGDPVGTKIHSSEELKKQGMIGVYKMMSLHEYLSHAWLCFKIDFKRKFHLYPYR